MPTAALSQPRGSGVGQASASFIRTRSAPRRSTIGIGVHIDLIVRPPRRTGLSLERTGLCESVPDKPRKKSFRSRDQRHKWRVRDRILSSLSGKTRPSARKPRKCRRLSIDRESNKIKYLGGGGRSPAKPVSEWQFSANREKNRETHAFERFGIAGCSKKPRVINILSEDSLSGGTGKVFADSGKQNRGIGNIQRILAAFQRSILELLLIGEVQ
jgi:hypothetical protein